MDTINGLGISPLLPPASTPSSSVDNSSRDAGDIEWFSASPSKPPITPTAEFTFGTSPGDISQKTLLHIGTSN